MQLQDKIVVITGSSQGLGKTMAEMFAKQGAKVVVSARKQEEIKDLAQEIGGLAVAADVTKEEQMLALAAAAVEKYGRIDIWVNNAGTWIANQPAEQLDLPTVHTLMDLNFFGVVHGSKAALGVMKKQDAAANGAGTIVNIISTSALKATPGSPGYVASKFAALGFTQAVRLELTNTGIKMIAVFPHKINSHPKPGAPKDTNEYTSLEGVAGKIIKNLQQDQPVQDLIIKDPKA